MSQIPSRKSHWPLLTQIPGVGVAVTNARGEILFANEANMVFFVGHTGVDYEGKTLSDLHPPEFVAERLKVIAQTLESKRPIAMTHVYLGRRIESFLWPIHDRKRPDDRVIVVTREAKGTAAIVPGMPDKSVERFESRYIDLGPLNDLSPRELEVLVLLGHGLTVPQAAKRLHRSPKTVERHKSAIGKKLHLRSQADIVRVVALLGLTPSDADLKRMGEHPIDKTPAPLPSADVCP